MRKTVLFLLLFLPNLFFGQNELQGKYCSRLDGDGFCVDFINDSNFIYTTGMDRLCIHGEGEYVINSNLFELKFNENENIDTSYHSLKKVPTLSSDSIELVFNIYNGVNSLEIPYVNIRLSKKKENKSRDIVIFGNSTDFSGIATFRLLKDDEVAKVIIRYADYKDYIFELNLLGSYKIDVYLYSSFHQIIENEVYTYKILKMKKDEIILKTDERKFLLKRRD